MDFIDSTKGAEDRHKTLLIDDEYDAIFVSETGIFSRYPKIKFESANLKSLNRFEANLNELIDSCYWLNFNSTTENELGLIYQGEPQYQPFNKSPRLSVNDFLTFAIDLVSAIQHCHSKKIIINNLSSRNILYSSTCSPSIQLFNLQDAVVTPRESIKGVAVNHEENKVKYFSPEKTGRTNHFVDGRSDFYSLGIIFYEALFGQYPFSFKDVFSLIHCHLASEADFSLCESLAIPDGLCSIVAKLMQKDPELRYQTCSGLLYDLNHLQQLRHSAELATFTLAEKDFSTELNLSERALYGRAEEQALLQSQLEQCVLGNPQHVFVSGAPGIGKSHLIMQLLEPALNRKCYFISGKYEQVGGNRSYSAIIEAFRQLVDFIRIDGVQALQGLKEAFKQQFSESDVVLFDLIPELACLLFKDLEKTTSQRATKQKLTTVFSRFIKFIATPEHPLVLFIDDIQWADEDSLLLLESLLINPEIKHFYLLMSYRDTEVEQGHPVRLLIQNIANQQTELTQIRLAEFDKTTTAEMLVKVLHSTRHTVLELADLVQQKTQGNPFFITVLLQSLAEQGLLRCDNVNGWHWDRNEILAIPAANNVVKVLNRRIELLAPDCLNTVKVAAVVGDTIALNELSDIANIEAEALNLTLSPALNAGILILSDGRLLFAHDKVRESVLKLIKPDDLAQLHHQVATYLQSHPEDTVNQHHLFRLVRHFNQAIALIKKPQQQIELANMNVQCGELSFDSAAFELAGQYVKQGQYVLALQGSDVWASHYDLMKRSQHLAIQCDFIAGRVEQAEQMIDVGIQHASNEIDQCLFYECLIYQKTVKADYKTATSIGINSLNSLGIELSLSELAQFTQSQLSQLEQYLDKHSMRSLLYADDMTDSAMKAAIRIIMNMQPTAYMYYPELYVGLSVLMVNIANRYGKTPESAKAYITFAGVAASVMKDLDLAKQMFELGERLTEHYQDPVQKCRNNFIYIAFILHWLEPIHQSGRRIEEGYNTGVKCGDYQYAAFNLSFGAGNLFNQGMPLSELQGRLEHYMAFCCQSGHQMSIDTLDAFIAVIRNLTGQTQDALVFDWQDFDDFEFNQKVSFRSPVSGCYYRLLKAFTFIIYRQDLAAKRLLEEVEKDKSFMLGTSMYAELVYCQAVVIARTESDQQAIDKLMPLIAEMAEWVDGVEHNFQYKLAHINALVATIEQRADCLAMFETAAIEAKNKGFIHHAAIILEDAARFCRKQVGQFTANGLLAESCRLYEEWGATVKLDKLKLAHPELVEVRSNQTIPSESVDLDPLLNVSQVLSKSLQINDLVQDIIRITIEMAGAQKGILFVNTAQGLKPFVKGEVKVGQLQFTWHKQQAVEDFPSSVINFVSHSRQTLVLDDSVRDLKFQVDSYIKQAACKSILCMPLEQQGNIEAALYLENNLVCSAFSEQRLRMLEMLAGQVAISLSNANHYTNLESEVKSRTQEIAQKNDELERANEAKSEFLAKMSHEIRTPINAVIGLTNLTLKTKLDFEQKDNLEKVLESSDALLGIINDILDFSKIEAGKLTIDNIQFNLHKIIARVINICSLKAHEKGLELIVDVAPDMPAELNGDPLRLQQVLINLVNNAVKFTNVGHITLTVKHQHCADKQVQLHFEINDTGIGMTKSQCRSLFKSFSQADSSITRKYGGTGLGLAISKQLVELMGGDINVDSLQGSGSKFYFDIKLTEAEHIKPALPSEPNFSSLRVLVVDDNHIARQVIGGMLESFSAQVLRAESGFDAIEIVVEQMKINKPIDVILMDWRMPQMDGIATSKIIKNQLDVDQLPEILMISAYDRELALPECKKAGISQFLEKPVNASTLQDAISEYTSSRITSSGTAPSMDELDNIHIDLSGHKVLLVEDNAINRKVALGYLADTGLDIDIAENGIIALEKVAKQQYNLVLMDIQMPEMDGITATIALRNEYNSQQLPIVAMTAHAMKEERDRCMDAGMNSHISKPLNSDDLIREIANILNVKPTNVATTQQSEPIDLPILEQLDKGAILLVQPALQKMQGNSNLYLQLLNDFVEDYSDLRETTRQLTQPANKEAFYRFAHSLKSNAGYIGAKTLAEHAGELEKAIKREFDYLTYLNRVIEGCEAVISFIVDVTGSDITPEALEPSRVELQQALTLLPKLVALINESDAESETYAEQLVSTLTGSPLQPLAQHAFELIEDIEYSEALSCLAKLSDDIEQAELVD